MPRLDGTLTKKELHAQTWRTQHELDDDYEHTISRQDPNYVPRASAMLRGNFSLAAFGTPETVVWWAAHEEVRVKMEVVREMLRDAPRLCAERLPIDKAEGGAANVQNETWVQEGAAFDPDAAYESYARLLLSPHDDELVVSSSKRPAASLRSATAAADLRGVDSPLISLATTTREWHHTKVCVQNSGIQNQFGVAARWRSAVGTTVMMRATSKSWFRRTSRCASRWASASRSRG